MDQAIKSKIDDLLGAHDRRRAAAVEATRQAEDKQVDFLNSFKNIRDTTIKPAMEEIGNYIKQKGHDYRIIVDEDHIAVHGSRKHVPASIRFELLTADGWKSGHGHPGLSVICEKTDEQTRFHESTYTPQQGGSSGSAGKASLAELTADLIQKKLLSIISKVLG